MFLLKIVGVFICVAVYFTIAAWVKEWLFNMISDIERERGKQLTDQEKSLFKFVSFIWPISVPLILVGGAILIIIEG